MLERMRARTQTHTDTVISHFLQRVPWCVLCVNLPKQIQSRCLGAGVRGERNPDLVSVSVGVLGRNKVSVGQEETDLVFLVCFLHISAKR